MKRIFSIIAAFFAPLLALAQGNAPIVQSNATTAGGILTTIGDLVKNAIPIIVGLAVAYFFFGVVKYVTAKDETKQKEARSTMLYGIIGIFVMVSLWGIIYVLSSTLGIGQGGTVPIPTF